MMMLDNVYFIISIGISGVLGLLATYAKSKTGKQCFVLKLKGLIKQHSEGPAICISKDMIDSLKHSDGF